MVSILIETVRNARSRVGTPCHGNDLFCGCPCDTDVVPRLDKTGVHLSASLNAGLGVDHEKGNKTRLRVRVQDYRVIKP